MTLKERTVVLTGVDTDGNTTIDMPITTVENVEGAIKTVDGYMPDANGNIDTKRLPLSGGTITGLLKFNCGVINSTSNDAYKETWFSAGQNWGDGGIITLYRRDSPAAVAGGFSVVATNDNGNTLKALIGKPDGSLTWNGTSYAYAFQISSDVRLKSNLEKIESALDKVSKLAAYTYDKQGVDGRQAGVIAQDVEKVLPEAVRENDEGYKTVDYAAVTALLINAINELRGEINGIKLS